jgi:hypothetical protein
MIFIAGSNRSGLTEVSGSFELNGNMAIGGWVRWFTIDSAERDFMTKGWVGNANRRWAVGRSTAGVPLFSARLNSGYTQCFGSTTMSSGVLYHIHGQKTSGQMEVYLNGSVNGTNVNGNGVADGPAPFGIGNGDDNSHYMYGDVGECYMYSTNLTAGEILSLSRGASPLTVRRGNLAGYWPLYPNQPYDWTSGPWFPDHSSSGIELRYQFSGSPGFSTIHPPVQPPSTVGT